MNDNNIRDFFLERLKAKGWLSISSLYFDNAYAIDIFTTHGYVAYSPGKDLFFTTNCLDTTNTQIIEDTYIALDRRKISQQYALTVSTGDCLQHFDLALYTHYTQYSDDQTESPWPEIPTKDEIMGYTLNEETGLYDGPAIAEYISGEQKSVVPMFKDGFMQSGARIAEWQRFYRAQERFCKMIGEMTGIGDCI